MLMVVHDTTIDDFSSRALSEHMLVCIDPSSALNKTGTFDHGEVKGLKFIDHVKGAFQMIFQ